MHGAIDVLILGGGITGVCTAYYCRELLGAATRIVVVDSEGRVAACASGRAGGFLAPTWADSALAARSFALHADLARVHGGGARWLFRGVDTFSVRKRRRRAAAGLGRRRAESGCVLVASWVLTTPTPAHTQLEQIGSTDNTAQVHPQLFCGSLFELSNATLVHASVVDLATEGSKATHVTVKHAATGEIETLSASHIVIALGPWCDPIARLRWKLPIRPVDSHKGYSVILKPNKDHTIPAQCLFTEIGKMEGPEVYPRADGTVYVCGGGSDDGESLPATPSLVTAKDTILEKLVLNSKTICPEVLGDADVVTRQACYLPLSAGGPMIGRIDPFDNLYIGTANSVWGIMNGPATGLAIAEIIRDGSCSSLDLGDFNP
ncbi:FAD dependent oxidoreductase, partial [Obelidium mucronatum]